MVNIFINDPRLKKILKKIEMNKNLNQLYSSKWHKVANFLYNNTGLTIAKVGQLGSIGKGTAHRSSDLDVGFCTSPKMNKNKIRDTVYEKAIDCFGSTVDINKGKNAIHIDFKSPKGYIDLVYLTQSEFNQEYKEVKFYKQRSPQQQDAIKIAKYAFDTFLKGAIRGDEVEKACITLNCSQLNSCLRGIINYFTGRLRDKGYTVDRFLRKILNELK